MTANFAEIHVPAKLIVSGNAAQTAANIIAHEQLFRLGIASDMITFATDVVLIAALYVVLKPVKRNLALLAAFWGLVETSIMVVAILHEFDILHLLSGADYLRVLEPDRLNALTLLSVGAYGSGYQVGLWFLGLRSLIFAYLWFRSRYIPRALAAWGVFSSLLVVICTWMAVVFPTLASPLRVASLVPIGIFELAMVFWLLFAKLRPSTTVAD